MTHCVIFLVTFVRKMPLDEVPVSCFWFVEHSWHSRSECGFSVPWN